MGSNEAGRTAAEREVGVCVYVCVYVCVCM